MTKLTDTQLIVLTAAAARDDGSILPLPKTIRGAATSRSNPASRARAPSRQP